MNFKNLIIVLDESKKLGEGKIVIGGFLSSHNKQYIDTFVKNKINDFGIQKNRELKSLNDFGKKFLDNLENDNDFKNLNVKTFGYYFEGYFRDNEEKYLEFLFEVFEDLLKYINCEKVIIFHDNISLKNKNDFISNIKKFFKNKKIKSEFEINDSKLNFSLQLADLLLSKYKEKFLFEDILYLPDFILKKDLENKKI